MGFHRQKVTHPRIYKKLTQHGITEEILKSLSKSMLDAVFTYPDGTIALHRYAIALKDIQQSPFKELLLQFGKNLTILMDHGATFDQLTRMGELLGPQRYTGTTHIPIRNKILLESSDLLIHFAKAGIPFLEILQNKHLLSFTDNQDAIINCYFNEGVPPEDFFYKRLVEYRQFGDNKTSNYGEIIAVWNPRYPNNFLKTSVEYPDAFSWKQRCLKKKLPADWREASDRAIRMAYARGGAVGALGIKDSEQTTFARLGEKHLEDLLDKEKACHFGAIYALIGEQLLSAESSFAQTCHAAQRTAKSYAAKETQRQLQEKRFYHQCFDWI